MDGQIGAIDPNVMFILYYLRRRRRRRRRHHDFWVHELFQVRHEGHMTQLVPRLMRLPDKFFAYFRMTREQMAYLENLVSPLIVKQDTHYRNALRPREKLLCTIRYSTVILARNIRRLTLLHLSCDERSEATVIYALQT